MHPWGGGLLATSASGEMFEPNKKFQMCPWLTFLGTKLAAKKLHFHIVGIGVKGWRASFPTGPVDSPPAARSLRIGPAHFISCCVSPYPAEQVVQSHLQG